MRQSLSWVKKSSELRSDSEDKKIIAARAFVFFMSLFLCTFFSESAGLSSPGWKESGYRFPEEASGPRQVRVTVHVGCLSVDIHTVVFGCCLRNLFMGKSHI